MMEVSGVFKFHDFLRFLPFTWKIVLGFGAYMIVTFFLVMKGIYNGAFMFMYLCLQLALLLFLSWWAYGYYRLRQGTKWMVLTIHVTTLHSRVVFPRQPALSRTEKVLSSRAAHPTPPAKRAPAPKTPTR